MSLFENGHLLEVGGITRADLDVLFGVARALKVRFKSRTLPPVLKGRILGSLFFEPSTRTRMSFESAFLRLGGTVNHLGAVEQSSIQKGETFKDTIRMVQYYADVLVIRHPEPGQVQEAAAICSLPIINAGDGMGEHPTQALLDLFTIAEHRSLEGLSLALVGDLKHSRTVHSLLKLIPLFPKMHLKLVSPDVLGLPESALAFLKAHQVSFEVESRLERALNDVDAIYVTRLQKERIPNLKEFENYQAYYRLDRAFIEKHAKPDLMILHPLPRVDELAFDLDDLPGSLYFEQAFHGLLIRMALFYTLFQEDGEI